MARILIVEDDESVRVLSARALERAGHQVEISCDGASGLTRVEGAAGAYDLVVSDIRMPEMDGIEMAQEIARRFPGLKIVLMTGYADQRERAHGLEALIRDIITKPFTLGEIRDVVKGALTARVLS